MEIEVENISIIELSEIENLTLRSYNVCVLNNLTDVHAILKYYWEYGDFLELKNCGVMTNMKLVNICKKYEKAKVIPVLISQPELEIKQIVTPELVLNKIDSLNIRQKRILNIIIKNRCNSLPFRASNALRQFCGSEVNVKNIRVLYQDQEFKIENLRNIGKRIAFEIKEFAITIKKFIEQVSIDENSEEINYELSKEYFKSGISNHPSFKSEVIKNYRFSYGLPIFKILNSLIENKNIFDFQSKEVFKSCLNYYNSGTNSFEEIGQRLSISSTKVKQIQHRLYRGLHSTFSFLKEIDINFINLYEIDYSADYIVVDDKIVARINKTEKTNFNKLFINKVVSILLFGKYRLVGNEPKLVINDNYQSGHNWRTTYVISNEYAFHFKFEKFIDDIDVRLSQWINEDYCIHFETYLLQFCHIECIGLQGNITQIAEFMLFSEFGLTIHDNTIVFKKNTRKNIVDYVYE